MLPTTIEFLSFIGEDRATKLIARYGGTILRMPPAGAPDHYLFLELTGELRNLLGESMAGDVLRAFAGEGVRVPLSVLKTFPERDSTPSERGERIYRFRELYDAGVPLQRLALRFKVSKEEASKILGLRASGERHRDAVPAVDAKAVVESLPTIESLPATKPRAKAKRAVAIG